MLFHNGGAFRYHELCVSDLENATKPYRFAIGQFPDEQQTWRTQGLLGRERRDEKGKDLH